jgi:hypothetical protein
MLFKGHDVETAFNGFGVPVYYWETPEKLETDTTIIMRIPLATIVCIYIYIYIYIYTYIHTYIYTHTYIYRNRHTHTHTHTHIYIYIYIYTHTHTQHTYTCITYIHTYAINYE